MTDKEIIRALRCCAEGECKDCAMHEDCLLYTSPSPRDSSKSRMPSSA